MSHDITIIVSQNNETNLGFSIDQDRPIDFKLEQESVIRDLEIGIDLGPGMHQVFHSDDFSGTGNNESPLSLSTRFLQEFDNKLDKTEEASKVYGTDSEGNQTLYDAESFGQVDDVLVNGESVVENKVANITVPTKVSELDNDMSYLAPGDNVSTLVNDAHYLTSYTHEQGETSTVWTVVHNLNRYPSVTVVDSAGTTIGCTVYYINSNTCELKFNAAFKGTAYLN